VLNLSLNHFHTGTVPQMNVPAATQPNIQPGLSNQTHISLNLFDKILKTANTREELERSWAAIE
jgi:hypothetical protein